MNKPLHYWNRNWIPLTTSFIITGTYVFSCANSFLQCLLLNTPIFIHKDMTITRMSEMFAFNLALYKYWSLPQLGSLLNFIFSHYLHVPVPRYLLSFNISIKYKLYKEEEHNMILHLYISLFTRFFYTYSASPWDLTHFKNLAVPDIRFWQLIIDVLHVNGKNFARVVYYQAQQKWLIKCECLMSAPKSSYLIFTAAGRLSKMT